ncbi:hypothetical protein, partial [Clostridium sp. C8-1-8]|uniref:hypothetical protein n=1 Tax=Clostridium sp. C8-1-8 TaxID=2698831 RepID=UPI001A9B0135
MFQHTIMLDNQSQNFFNILTPLYYRKVFVNNLYDSIDNAIETSIIKKSNFLKIMIKENIDNEFINFLDQLALNLKSVNVNVKMLKSSNMKMHN